MDMHRTLIVVNGARAYMMSKNAVDCLVAACPQNRRAEDLLGTGVDQYLHKAFSRALLEGTRPMTKVSRGERFDRLVLPPAL